MSSSEEQLKKLREPFPANQISKLPKPTKQQTNAVKENFKNGIRCEICGGWHHPNVVHLDYVGHAALTDRLLETDPYWNWEPASGEAPALDNFGGMWIKLTVCGVTRLGYGHADGKTGGDAVKEVIGDAIRNAAMRFGAALDLWHKGDLHAHMESEQCEEEPAQAPTKILARNTSELLALMNEGDDFAVAEYWRKSGQEVQQRMYSELDKETQKALKELLKNVPAQVEKAS